MSTQTHRDRSGTDVSIPDDVESARAKLVYLYLSTVGGASAEEIADHLGLGTGTALTITNTLRSYGHVERQDGRFVAV